MGSNAPIGPDTLVSRNDEPVAVEVDRTVVMMSVEQGKYFGLEGTGPRIWALLERPRSVQELCEALMAEYQVEPETCLREVTAFLEELRRTRLIQIDGNPTDPLHPAAGG